MSDPYIGEIRMFAGNFPPSGWALCNGQVLSIADNEPLFNLIGTTYGGDGQQSFALPNLNGRFPTHFGAAHDGSTFQLAQTGGSDQVILTTNQLPAHAHSVVTGSAATTASANGAYPAAWADAPYTTAAPDTALAPQQLAPQGGSQPHENRQPYLAMTFIISLFGIYPSST